MTTSLTKGSGFKSYDQMAAEVQQVLDSLERRYAGTDAIGDAGTTSGKAFINEVLIDRLPISADSKRLLSFVSDNLTDYLAYCKTNGLPPYSQLSFRKYAAKYGLIKSLETTSFFAGLSQHETVECITTIAIVVLQSRDRFAAMSSGMLPGFAAGLGMLALDALAIGNACPQVQQGYYELFLRTSNPRVVRPARRLAVSKDAYTLLPSTLGTANRQLMCSIPSAPKLGPLR